LQAILNNNCQLQGGRPFLFRGWGAAGTKPGVVAENFVFSQHFPFGNIFSGQINCL